MLQYQDLQGGREWNLLRTEPTELESFASIILRRSASSVFVAKAAQPNDFGIRFFVSDLIFIRNSLAKGFGGMVPIIDKKLMTYAYNVSQPPKTSKIIPKTPKYLLHAPQMPPKCVPEPPKCLPKTSQMRRGRALLCIAAYQTLGRLADAMTKVIAKILPYPPLPWRVGCTHPSTPSLRPPKW